MIVEVRLGYVTKSKLNIWLTRKRVGALTDRCRRHSVATSRSWRSAVF